MTIYNVIMLALIAYLGISHAHALDKLEARLKKLEQWCYGQEVE